MKMTHVVVGKTDMEAGDGCSHSEGWPYVLPVAGRYPLETCQSI